MAYTPMMQQYLAIKQTAQDAFLFFRLGDFYELFFEDAILASKQLDLTLTGREAGGAERIPMCGVPHHSVDGYIAKLVEQGYKVAICDQVEEAGAGKGVVRREIVRVITPGTVMDTKSLQEGANHFIGAVVAQQGGYGISIADLTTGELYVTSVSLHLERLLDELNVYRPREIVGEPAVLAQLESISLQWGVQVTLTAAPLPEAELVHRHFEQEQYVHLNVQRFAALSLMMGYLTETQKRSLAHIRQVRTYEPHQYMVIDPFTRRNLELTETVRDRSKKGTLLWLLDRSETSMGARMLRRWIDKPLYSVKQILQRQEAVHQLYHNLIVREDIRAQLKQIYDLERLVGRVSFGSANGRDLHALRSSLEHVPALMDYCLQANSSTLHHLASSLDLCEDLAQQIAATLVDEPPVSIRDGGLIRDGFDPYLDQLREASVSGKRWLAELEQREREATGIKTLKIGYNKVFGYYLEVSKAASMTLPEGRYERKQTLANAERYVTPELKQKERLILEAQEKMIDLEYARFIELRESLAQHLPRLQKLAEAIATIDVLQSLATVAGEQRFVRPTVTEATEFDLIVEDGRHPVVEAMMQGSPFIANQTTLTADEQSMLLITGPNMAGKSTYMRQVALICVMAQIGSFVPAKRATVPLVDRIFTRIGAADDLVGGQSTFMVEMKDIQTMTEYATKQSLVIIDELGRGTSTAEGMAIAQAVIEFVHHDIGCKALVSTHFHELAHLEQSLPKLANACMAVQESKDTVTFLRKLVPGAASSSYGIYCAELAGLPGSIIQRAYTLLEHHETPQRQDVAPTKMPKQTSKPKKGSVEQLDLFAPPVPSNPQAEQLLTELEALNVHHMTPIQALMWIATMKEQLSSGR